MNQIGLILKFTAVILSVFYSFGSAHAQLRITEVMADSVDDTNWEWIEVQNTSGTPLDINGFVFDDDDSDSLDAANIRTELSGNTVITAN